MARCFRGFSLVEIVVALAIISFALVAIIGLFPVAMSAAKEGRNETRAASIAQLIFGQLRTHDPKQKALPLGPDPTKTSTTDGNLNLSLQASNSTTTNEGYMAFTGEGEPIRRITPAQYDDSSVAGTLSAAVYKVRVQAMPNQPISGLARVKVDVTYPASAPLASRSTNTFSLLLNNVSP